MHKTRSLIWPLRRPQGVTIDVVSITYLRNPRIAHSRESPPAGDTFVRCLQRGWQTPRTPHPFGWITKKVKLNTYFSLSPLPYKYNVYWVNSRIILYNLNLYTTVCIYWGFSSVLLFMTANRYKFWLLGRRFQLRYFLQWVTMLLV